MSKNHWHKTYLYERKKYGRKIARQSYKLRKADDLVKADMYRHYLMGDGTWTLDANCSDHGRRSARLHMPCRDCVRIAEERERIIELLETLKVGEACCADCQPHADRNRHYLTSVIALIKGENE